MVRYNHQKPLAPKTNQKCRVGITMAPTCRTLPNGLHWLQKPPCSWATPKKQKTQMSSKAHVCEMNSEFQGTVTMQLIPMSLATACRPDSSRGWMMQRIPTSSTALVCKTDSELHGPLQPHQPRLDDTADSNEFYNPCLHAKQTH